MKLVYYCFKCNDCETKFKSPMIGGDFVYGEFLMRTKKGEYAYLNAISSTTWDEFSHLFYKHPSVLMLKESTTKVFQALFGLICDSAPSGKLYNINQEPLCTKCDQDNTSIFKAINPPEFVNLDIPNVTHTKWNSLSSQQKQDLIYPALSTLILKSIVQSSAENYYNFNTK